MPYNIEDIKAGVINPELPKKPVLYLFDKSYDLLGQIPLDKKSDYYFINAFATSEGLWMQKISDDENFMTFELIEYNINQ